MDARHQPFLGSSTAKISDTGVIIGLITIGVLMVCEIFVEVTLGIGVLEGIGDGLIVLVIEVFFVGVFVIDGCAVFVWAMSVAAVAAS